jgi:HSP20 family protein
MEEKMNVRDLIPWGRQNIQAPSIYRGGEASPLLTLHREMNRLFDEVFRGFDVPPFGQTVSWPSLEVAESDNEVHVTLDVPGVDEKDVEILLSDGMLTIRGEKKSETEDKERHFSERYFGRFERRIPLDWEVDEDKVTAVFKNGVLTVTMPKSAKAQQRAKRIPISSMH